MFDKLKFNNLVISNKKGIQQSRIQTINKLVHKIRKLKTLLEKHPDDIKCKERIRKSNETMKILKKIKRVEIMKKILLINKPPASVITNGLATPEEVAIALLSMNKVMLGLIKRFKSELLLDESKREKWQQVLTETSKRRRKIERTEEKRRKRLEMKQQKVLGYKRQEWLEQNCTKDDNANNDNENSNDLNISTMGNWQIDKLSNEAEEDKRLTKIEVVSNTLVNRSIKEKNRKTDIRNNKQMISAKKNEGNNESDAEKIEKSIVDFEGSKGHKSSEEENEESLVVDPFFITDTGENYLSAAVVKNDQNTNENNGEEKRDLHMIKLNNVKKPKDFKDRRQQSRNENQKDYRNNKISANKGQKNAGETNMWTNKNINRDNKWQNKKSEKEANGQNLHPSWVAKQKFKPVITSFQGKKIKFDEDAETSKNQGPLHQNKNTKLSLPTSKAGNVDQDWLHPSWAAKQKLKPTITTFQGKKITFDNED